MQNQSSEKTKDLYAYYGLAMLQAQSLECMLVQAIYVFVIFPSSTEEISKIVENNSLDEWEKFVDSQDEKLIRNTMGKLIIKLKKSNLPDNLINVLETALKYRNFLAHEFFVENMPKLYDEKGLEEATLYVRKAGGYIKNLVEDLTPVIRSAQTKYGYDEQCIKQHIEKRIYEARKSYDL